MINNYDKTNMVNKIFAHISLFARSIIKKNKKLFLEYRILPTIYCCVFNHFDYQSNNTSCLPWLKGLNNPFDNKQVYKRTTTINKITGRMYHI